ncbi:hypothetical protein LCGC14_1055730 [marine sediment metagenome]|uniref:Uncharacterized protein n=1 Tax=marine sediment metagenome TaxID=412755 RepID=A0A0F9N9G5_9ZZZZ
MPNEEKYTFKVTLVFWKFYELGLYFDLPEVRKFLEEKTTLKLYDGYRFKVKKEDGSQIDQPLKWISGQSHNYAPICFKISGSDRFSCSTVPSMVGKLRIEGHIHYGSVLVIHCELVFENYHKIEELIEISQPQNIIVESTGRAITEKFIEIRENLITILKRAKYPEKAKLESSLEPWHHTWIIWDANPDFNKVDYRFIGNEIGKNATYSIGLTLRTDKYLQLDPIAYRDQINLKNLSPYKDEFVMITHAGNVIIPGSGLLDPYTMKKILIDTIFAPEVGNVQRLLILMHMENILSVAERFDRVISETRAKEEELTLRDKIDRLEALESELNRIVLELNKDVIISKITRLLFTSTFKTSIFNEMIDKLDGFTFAKQTDDVIKRIRTSLNRERNTLNTKSSAIENKFLAILNYLALFELAALVISLALDDVLEGKITGTIQIIVAIALVVIAFILYRI